jgi:hypothetical protein
MVQVVLEVVQVNTPPSPSSAVAVYPDIGEPPLSGAVHEMASDVLPATTCTDEGVSGGPNGVDVVAKDASESPLPLVAMTVTL